MLKTFVVAFMGLMARGPADCGGLGRGPRRVCVWWVGRPPPAARVQTSVCAQALCREGVE